MRQILTSVDLRKPHNDFPLVPRVSDTLESRINLQALNIVDQTNQLRVERHNNIDAIRSTGDPEDVLVFQGKVLLGLLESDDTYSSSPLQYPILLIDQ